MDRRTLVLYGHTHDTTPSTATVDEVVWSCQNPLGHSITGFTRIERVAKVDPQGTIIHHNLKKRSMRMSQTYGFITLENSIRIAGDLRR